jgi:ABC-2 type transport system permease protein
LENYGVRVEHNLILDASCGQVQIPQQVGPFQMNVAVNYPYFVKVIAEDLNKNIPAVSSISEMVLPWTSSLSLLVPNRDSVAKVAAKSSADSGVKASALIKSSKKSWTVAGNFDLNPQQKWAPTTEGFKQSCLMAYLTGNFKSYFAGKSVPLVNEADSAKKDSLSKTPAAIADKNREIVGGNKGRHLVVAANASFLTAQFGGIPGNTIWLQNVVDWLSSDENLISIRTRTMVDRSIRKDELKEGSMSATIVRICNLGLMPLAVVVFGLFIFFRRREVAGPVSSAEKTEEKKS